MTFRVHFADGAKVDVQAETSAQAEKAARKRHAIEGAIVTKIKVVREIGKAA